MTFAQGSRSELRYVVESTFGVTPSSPSMIVLPFNTHSLSLTKERVQGNEIRSDRIPRVDRHGNRSVVGDVVVDLRADDFDDLLESAFFSALDSSGVMSIGTTPKFMTIEDAAVDIAQYRQFAGLGVSSMSLSIAPNQMIGATFSMVGKDLTQAVAPLDATPTAPSANQPFDSYTGTLSEGGSTIAIVASVDLTLTNSLAPTFVVGSDSTPQLEFGRAVVEGTLTAYYQDAVLINKFLNETASTLTLAIADPGSANTYTFLIPEVKYNGADVPVANEQSRVITLPFVGIYDTVQTTNLKLTKS
jgi:hypothetical protein